MNRLKLLVLTQIAVLALGAVASASASAAAPAFVPNPGESFPSSIGNSMHAGSVSFTWPAQTWGTCSENKTSGTITGPKVVSLTLEWAGCSQGWHTEGSPEGHIVISGTGTLSYISQSPEQVGVVLAMKEVKILSGSSSIKLRGTVVIPITPLQTATTKFGLPIHQKSLGEQEIGSYENEEGKVVEARPQIEFGTSFKKAAIEVQGANELTTGKTFTIQAVSPPSNPAIVAETFPVALEGSAPATQVALEGAAGKISCEGVNTKGTITESRALSVLTYELQHCKDGSTAECQTAGAAAGTVVLTGSAHLFYIHKAFEQVALVWSLSEAKITCGAAKAAARGALVIRVTPLGGLTTQPVLSLTRNGEALENTYKTYENDKGEVITAKIELEFGSGFKKGLLQTGELPATSSKAVMIEG